MVFLTARARVIAMRMRQHGSPHRSPGIDVEITRRAVQPVLGHADQQSILSTFVALAPIPMCVRERQSQAK
jgi:hypothetical protein